MIVWVSLAFLFFFTDGIHKQTCLNGESPQVLLSSINGKSLNVPIVYQLKAFSFFDINHSQSVIWPFESSLAVCKVDSLPSEFLQTLGSNLFTNNGTAELYVMANTTGYGDIWNKSELVTLTAVLGPDRGVIDAMFDGQMFYWNFVK
jgi:hypothetical protein